MASFLSKFARGAAAAGGKLYADMAMQDMRSNLTAKREETLQANRVKLQRERQVFKAEGAEQERIRQAAALTERRTYKEEQTLKAQEFRAGEAEKARTFRAGEAKKKAAVGETVTLENITTVARMLERYQKDNRIREGDEGFLTTEQTLSTAQTYLKNLAPTDKKFNARKIKFGDIFGAKATKFEPDTRGAPYQLVETRPETPDLMSSPVTEPATTVAPTPTAPITEPIGEPIVSPDFISAVDLRPGESTATNPKTGERMVKRGGVWLPIR